MIFVTVGTQLPFDRLITAMDRWAARHADIQVIAQAADSAYQAQALEQQAYVAGEQYAELFARADLVVAHAGMGTILSALEQGKPLVVLPRQERLGEHRNDHQLGTARYFAKYELIRVVMEEGDLAAALDSILASPPDTAPVISSDASPELIEGIRDFLRSY